MTYSNTYVTNTDVIRGCSGDVKLVTLEYLNGEIKDSGDSCHEHEHGCHN